jgi:pimeloyl-ACP methyl ester carboxylesterase
MRAMQVIELLQGQVAYWAAGEGPPLLFIHGVGTTGELWFRDLQPLASSHYLIVHNRRGYRYSSESPPDWSGHRDDAAALLAALGVQRAAVVGYSGGASVALDLALQQPELVSSLVLLDPAVNIKRCVTPGFVKALLIARLLRRLRGERAGAEYWMRYVASYATGGTAFDKVSTERREAILANARGMFADAQSATAHAIDEARMRSLTMPVAIVDAKLSPPFLRRSSERLRRAMPQARSVTIESAGHHVMIDARDEVLAILRDVLGATAAAPAAPPSVPQR